MSGDALRENVPDWKCKAFRQQSLEKPWYAIAERTDAKGLRHLINAEGVTEEQAAESLKKLLENRR